MVSQSIDMYSTFNPPTVSFLAGSGLGISSSFLPISSPYRRHLIWESNSALNKQSPVLQPWTKKSGLFHHQSMCRVRRSLIPNYHQLSNALTLESKYQCQKVYIKFPFGAGVNVLCGMGLLSTPYANPRRRLDEPMDTTDVSPINNEREFSQTPSCSENRCSMFKAEY
ncbi:hypothetical protein IFM89_008648 [Coptis chinensis]|uniref:Uncharacterized protein n=1 Tax=Coptis chinensis TaxID=261450 RepID=A0A835H784_9MAGN|nr:hypothetical protein IFM89_008648 [Coptis chinensis]